MAALGAGIQMSPCVPMNSRAGRGALLFRNSVGMKGTLALSGLEYLQVVGVDSVECPTVSVISGMREPTLIAYDLDLHTLTILEKIAAKTGENRKKRHMACSTM
jgi:hypothetical protein